MAIEAVAKAGLAAAGLEQAAAAAKADTPPSEVFSSVLAEAVGRVEGYRADAEQAVKSFLAGEDEELHRVAIATQQAELSFDLFLQVKNRVVQAYQEVMRMQL